MVWTQRRSLALLLLLFFACKKKGPADDEATRGMALGALADIKQAIAQTKARFGTPDAAQGHARCASVAYMIPDLREPQFGPIADDLERACKVELPAAELAVALEAIEADRTRCQAIDLATDLQLLEKAPAPEVVKNLARYRELCVEIPLTGFGARD